MLAGDIGGPIPVSPSFVLGSRAIVSSLKRHFQIKTIQALKLSLDNSFKGERLVLHVLESPDP